MNIRTFASAAVLPILAIALAAPGLQAATVTYSSNFSLNNPVSSTNAISNPNTLLSTVTQTFTDATSPITLSKFNPSMGTLNSITFTLTLTTSSTSGSATIPVLTLLSNISIDRTITLTVNNPAFTAPVQSSSSTLNQATLVGLLNSINLGLGRSGPYTTAGPTGFGISTTTPTQLAALTGAGGTFTSTLSSSDIYTIAKTAGVGTIDLSGATSYAGMLAVTYNFTAIPEPSTWSMVGVFMLGFIIFTRKRRGVA